MLAVVAIRVVTALAAFLVYVTFPLDRPEQFTVFGTTHYFWDPFARYDSGWYFGIASRGYEWAAGGRSNIAFFPAYPWVMGVLGRIIGGTQSDFYFAGIVVSWVCSIASAGFVYGVARLDLPSTRAWHAALADVPVPVRVLLRRGLFGGAVPARPVGGHLRSPHPAVVAGCARGCRHDGHPRQRHHGAAGARVDGVASRRRGSDGACEGGGGKPDRQRGHRSRYCAYNWQVTGSPFEWYHAITRWGYYPGTALGANPLVMFVDESCVTTVRVPRERARRPVRRHERPVPRGDGGDAAAPVAPAGYRLCLAHRREPGIAAQFGAVRGAGPLLGRDVPVSNLGRGGRHQSRGDPSSMRRTACSTAWR